MDTSDNQLTILIHQCRSGNQHALETLYKQCSPFLHTLALRIVRCEDLSNEVIQDSFIQIWENATNYCEQRGRPIVWMCGIVRNRAIDKLRTEKKHLRGQCSEIGIIDVDQLAGDSQPELEVSRQQSQLILLRCLAELPVHEQRSINMAYLQGHSCQDLANTFDANVNTVKSWLRRGSQHLKQYLSPKVHTIEWCDSH